MNNLINPITFDKNFFTANDNSMIPIIKNGDFVTITPFENDSFSVENGAIYVVSYYGDILIKRVTRNNKIKEVLLNSDNKEDYPQIKINCNEYDNFKILGRIVTRFGFL